ncbi:RNA-dependent RNA polymerase 1-like [Juglans microcarpa x Juglans regia]|uniref:RNA-dependent RNA polymerase 1-like n=1 Tax=Juglans microcarpa x Juglans regia TaxID=2249226 RepID=UPI001B7E8296|nr:RNA-dependent RNA polymerase 1-like [Juglans microcarpa x Juglans regia]XP_041014136.1 RNA-dependent RNA polymerase 1-like [Juglans microcarpa x Juglans regia]
MGKTIHLSGFPSSVTAQEVQEFLERHTGEGTVYAIKIRPNRSGGQRANATVQFTSNRHAESIISLANVRLWYGRSYLKAWEMERDIVPKPRTFLHSLENIILHFGCQISNEKFSILWRAVNVSVNFGTGLRKFQFVLSLNSVEYKLELSYENIWQIELHRPRRQTAKYLLIQLFGAPRIYEKDSHPSDNLYENPLFNFFKDIPDDQWVRGVDFTPSCCIGQSSSLCLELPYGHQLPDFRENFAYYKESEGRYILESGSTFSCNLDLVPIVGPSPGVDLPYEILFKINSLVQHGCLSGPTLDVRFYRLVNPRTINIACIEYALEKLSHIKECCYDPLMWLNEQYRKYLKARHPPKSPAILLDSGLFYVRRVQITPSKVYFCGPEINISNRVLRNFPDDIDNFLRVSFVDEDLDKMFSTDLSPRASSANEDRKTGIYKRILSVLRNGIVFAGKKFETLAFSSSQLRDNSIWMFASRDGLSAADIRAWMGDFCHIRNVAKYAARLGQSFGSSTETLTVHAHEIEIIPDVELKWGGVNYVFSDGIGKISAGFAKKVALKCGFKGSHPSAFQIRYGGYKGVVAVDPTSPMKLSLRKSMSKYEADNHKKLDVLAFSKFQPCFLNRQLITLLSTLGVKDNVFENKQRQAIEQLDAILRDPLKAQEALDLMSPGENTNILKEMLMCGYKPDAEPFLAMMLQTFRASKLLELRTKTRIFIPDGRAMMGCLDETGTLEYGQVFVQFSGTRHKQSFNDSSMFGNHGSDQHFLVTGKVVVAKNPCLHPGDVRVLRAVNVPALHHLVDCVVFPQKGLRPHPNECSGSDLDGDIYFVCWDPELIPPRQNEPMDYSPAKSMQLDHDVTIEEVEEYFVNYIVNDSLGIIANAHTAFADREPQKAMSGPCIELAKLFSIAVDFPKTGVPAEIPRELRVKDYPDFMDKPDKPTYESHNVIGKLYREVKDIAPNNASFKSFTVEMARRSYDPDMEIDGFEDFVDDAFFYKNNYDYKLGNLMDYYGIKTEAEILSGNIMRMAKSFTKRRDAEAINVSIKSLRKEARAWFNKKESGLDSGADEVYAKASAWYHVTYHPSYWGSYNEGMDRDHFLSFPWCVYDKLVRIKKNKTSITRALYMSSLEHQFGRELHL